jgi:hypothetical protein
LANRSTAWTAIEFRQLDLGDARLNWRARTLDFDEMMFKVRKNGCCVEELQLGTIACIGRALALYLVAAWRVACVMRTGPARRDLGTRLFFDPDGTRPAYLLNKALPPAPRLNEVLRKKVRRGGFLARKSDGEPDARMMWEGLRDVSASVHAINSLAK